MARTIHYTTRARFTSLLGANLATSLLDFDKDGTEDTGLYDGLRDRAENRVDRELRQKYAVPFADVETEALDETVSDLTDDLIKLYVLEKWRPGSKEFETLEKKILTAFADLRSGQTELDESKVASGTGKRLVSTSSDDSPGTTFAGTTNGVSKMRGF